MFQRNVVEKIKTYILCSLTLFPPENRAVYETAWKNMVDADGLQMTGRRMRDACWVHKVTDTHSEFVIRIAFLLQQGLHECNWKLHCSTMPVLYDDVTVRMPLL
jgi:hypothetical protein